MTAPLTATISSPFFLQPSGLCPGRANYCQSPDPGIRLLPWRQVSLVWLCCKASPSWQRAPSSPQQFLPTAPWPVGSLLHCGGFPFPLLPRFNFPTLLLEENFKSGSIFTVGFFFFLSLLKNAIQEAKPNTYLNTTATSVTTKAQTAGPVTAFSPKGGVFRLDSAGIVPILSNVNNYLI